MLQKDQLVHVKAITAETDIIGYRSFPCRNSFNGAHQEKSSCRPDCFSSAVSFLTL